MKRRMPMLFLPLLVCSCAFLSLSSVSFFPAQRFAAAQAQWQASDIRNYEAVIQVSIPQSIQSDMISMKFSLQCTGTRSASAWCWCRERPHLSELIFR